jgi:rhamnosyl/mannosyltransferase
MAHKLSVLQLGKFYPPRWGGMETAVRDLCEVLRRSVDLRLLVANHERGDRIENRGGVEVHRLRTWGQLFSQPLTPGLWRRIRSSPAGIVHLHEPNPLAMISFLLSGHPGRLVIHYHSDVVRQKRMAVAYRPWLERGLQRAAAVIVGSEELLDSSPVLAGWRSKCHVIPFGIDLDPFLSITRSETHSHQPPTVLAVGRLSYYKGFQHLIEAMAQTPARLVIVGEGPERAELEAQIRRLGLASRVQLTGAVSSSRLRTFYRQADVFCLSSCERSEAYGLVQLEAMGAGLPVVSTDLPTGVRAINVCGETGLVVPPGDVARLAAALSRLAADAPLRRRMGEAARERARKLFSRDRMAARVLELYKAVAQQQLGGSPH